MLFETKDVGQYRVFSFSEDIDARSDISHLLLTIEEDIKRGVSCFAVEFSARSYLYSKTLAVLVRCMNTVRDAGGRLAVVSENKKLLEAIEMFHLDTMLPVCCSLDELPEC
ncbi:MAG: hypothetical protein GF344_02495 [Chitinivibrionales bacterium]|nr:hypothetical protein [Chitinivibrionales bacterium]MBD3355956.1 hypothetical protein [Chitinivibrionales bacterium]